MVKRRDALALALVGAFVLSGGMIAQKKDDKKQSDAQRKEIQEVVKVVDTAATGQPAPNDLGLAWLKEDFLKAQGNKEYVPFSVMLDSSKVTSPNVAFYWRVVAQGAAAVVEPKPAADAKDAKKDDKKDAKAAPAPLPRYAYEDIAFIPVAQGQNPTRISRSFTVPAGTYDVYLVVKEPTSQQKNAPMPKASMIKQTVTVPDFWSADLSTSSVIVAQRIDPLAAPLSPQEQADRPYALGAMEIIPQFDMKFTKKGELSTFMLIYNPKTDSANKPDVSVEYNFYSKPSGGAEKFFNKTSPQNLNAQTLPPQFDFALGHQLQTGQAVPLASFPEGDYRLEIKVTDKLANKSVTRDVNFSVTAG
jgi:hypothetical protein